MASRHEGKKLSTRRIFAAKCSPAKLLESRHCLYKGKLNFNKSYFVH